MLLTKTVIIKWSGFTKKWYESKGYEFTKLGNEFEVKVEDLLDGSSSVFVEVKCNNIDCKNPYFKPMTWRNYKRSVHKDGKYYCHDCAIKLFGVKNRVKSALLNGKSFEQWCIEHNRQDILDRWNYELNKCKPSEICYSTKVKYWFKCSINLHPSELKRISDFVQGHSGVMDCKACNSFAQWGIINIDKDLLEKYWDYEKNEGIDLWGISKRCNKKIWIKCQKKDYHGSYEIRCGDFIRGDRCPYCHMLKVHPLDSLGQILENKGLLHSWSNKNKKSPYEYAPYSVQEAWWRCPSMVHKDFKRSASSSSAHNFRCPECQYSKGEKKIEEYLKFNNINYISQKEFNGLIGLGGGNLSYDFYLPLLEYNLLIEFQGIQHEKYIEGFYKSKKDFKKQKEHDKRKKQYSIDNNIKLLEIWYYDFDNIEIILDKELKINNKNVKEVI